MATSSLFASLDELMAYAWAREFGYIQTAQLALDYLHVQLSEVDFANDYEARDREFDRVVAADKAKSDWHDGQDTIFP